MSPLQALVPETWLQLPPARGRAVMENLEISRLHLSFCLGFC